MNMQRKKRFKTPTMFKKRLPMLRKAWDLLAFSIPTGKRLYLTMKRSRKLSSSRKLIDSRNYPFIGEYQFSPPSTPLFHHSWGRIEKGSKPGLSSLLLLCICSKNGAVEEEEEEEFICDTPVQTKTWAIEDNPAKEVEEYDSTDEDDSVDQRAEKFIARFYEHVRIQRQESSLQYMQMMSRGCT